MNKNNESKFALPLAVFGFMLIIATGVNMLIGNGEIPQIISFIGLILIVCAMWLRKRSRY